MLVDRGVAAPDAPRLEVNAESTTMIVLAGESAEQDISIINLSTVPDDFDITMEGLPSGWFAFSKQSVNLFPNWSDTVRLRVTISPKVRPNQYIGRVVVTSRSQPNVKSEVRLEIEVLSPLKVQARVDPHKGRGFKANYRMILRNRSMTEGIMNYALTADNPWCVAEFNPPQIRIPAGRTEIVKVKIGLRRNTPVDQKLQTQTWEAAIQPTWLVGDAQVVSPAVLVDADYTHESRWGWFQRNPIKSILIALIIILVAAWQLLIFPSIQSGLLAITLRVDYTGPVRSFIRVEQGAFTRTSQAANPVNGIVEIGFKFKESPTVKRDAFGQRIASNDPNDLTDHGTVETELRWWFISVKTEGKLRVDKDTADLLYVPAEPDELNRFPWFFMPPDQLIKTPNGRPLKTGLSDKIKDWLKPQRLRMVDTYIEGNTIYITVRTCTASDSTVACPRT